jgi:hypothetical protein
MLGKCDLPLRVVMDDPVPGVRIALQLGASGKAELVGPVEASAAALVFDFAILVDGPGPDGRPRLLGPFVQGPPSGRFVYLNSGTYAGEPGSSWGRRAKIPLGGLSWPLIEAIGPGGRLEAHIAGKARDGGPACATVPILAPGWRPAL